MVVVKSEEDAFKDEIVMIETAEREGLRAIDPVYE
jgi:hypothetical protein